MKSECKVTDSAEDDTEGLERDSIQNGWQSDNKELQLIFPSTKLRFFIHCLQKQSDDINLEEKSGLSLNTVLDAAWGSSIEYNRCLINICGINLILVQNGGQVKGLSVIYSTSIF